MRATRLCFYSLLVVSLLSLCGPLLKLHAQTSSVNIDYTGSLMGYYRMEASESEPVLNPVKDFLAFRSDDPQHNNRLLLAMGDNFGPEFGASIQIENLDNPACAQQQKSGEGVGGAPISLYKDDDRFPRRANCDNVLNFLMHAGYRAVVPGRQDFMYTARWLRAAAVQLSQESYLERSSSAKAIANPEARLHLLAANLRITMTGSESLSRASSGARYSLNNHCPLLFEADPFAQTSVSCSSDGSESETLDLLDRLDRLNQMDSAGNSPTRDAMRELASESAETQAGRAIELNALVSDEVAIFHAAWGSRFPAIERIFLQVKLNASSGKIQLRPGILEPLRDQLRKIPDCPAAASSSDDARGFCDFASGLADILDNLSNLPQAGSYDSACHVGPGKKGTCFLLSDEARSAAINGLLRTIAAEQKDVGYTVSERDGHRTLIVGVVGSNTMHGVSATNQRLCLGGAVAQQPGHQDMQINDDHWPADFGSCDEQTTNDLDRFHFSAKVLVTDPVLVTSAVIRAAELADGDFDSVVVMAQMPRTDAEVLATHVWARLLGARPPHPPDLVISESEAGFATPSMTMTYALPDYTSAGADGSHPAPVLTPAKGYASIENGFPGAISRASLTIDRTGKSAVLTNTNSSFRPQPADSAITSVLLFDQLIKQFQGSTSTAPIATDPESKSKTELMLLQALQRSGPYKADIIFLQSRDLQLGAIGRQKNVVRPDYSGYEICPSGPNQNLCELHIALDRILWKGDYLEYVAVTGNDITQMLAASEGKIQESAELTDRDIDQEWLVSYGVVQSSLSDPTQVNRNNEPLWIPVDPSCHGTSGKHTYCIGGQAIVADAYYWLLTTDQLAQDDIDYKILHNLPVRNHKVSRTFLTSPLADYVLAHLGQPRLEAVPSWVAADAKPESACAVQGVNPSVPSIGKNVTCANEIFQQLPLLQVDFAKLVVSFSSRMPDGGNQFVGNYFQGVADARASAPSSQELDLEMANRIVGSAARPGSAFSALSFGLQTNLAYDRSVIGNLSPATKSINASYALNNFTAGGFLQIFLNGRRANDPVRSIHSLPRNLLVLAPRQYQVQINHSYLFFPFAQSSPVPGELTVTQPRTTGWTDRAGYRREFGAAEHNSFFFTGSYVETGMEFNTQNSVLAFITLQTGSTKKTCDVSANYSLQTCFSKAPALVINNTSTLVGSPAVETLRSPGVYWNIHLQNRILGRADSAAAGKLVSLVTDTTGDFYFGRSASAELPTQTRYAIPLSLSLNFPALGNLSFAPNYSAFFYQSQLSSQSLLVNSISISARWYLARDARVPMRWQIPLPGPQSSDQTKSAKSK